MIVIPRAPLSTVADDECSTHSTECVNRSAKGVTFDARSPEEYSAAEAHAELWYTKAELKQFKAASALLAKQIQKHEARITDAASYHNVLERALKAAQEKKTLSWDELAQLITCVNLSPTRLGLERLTVKALSKACSKRRAELQARVKAIQQMDNLPADKKEVILRMQCEKVTQVSRILAQQLADGVHGSSSAVEESDDSLLEL